MEQNLSGEERRQRLALGAGFGAGSLAILWRSEPFLGLDYEPVGLVFGALALGFIANYFTCFCGTKKALNAIKERF